VDHLQDEIELELDLLNASDGVFDTQRGANDEGVLDILLEALEGADKSFELFLPGLSAIQYRLRVDVGTALTIALKNLLIVLLL